jgi:arylsulfatase A-like enzyme
MLTFPKSTGSAIKISILISLALIVSACSRSSGPAQQPAAVAEASPNFVIILTDDQSWVGSSLLMDPDDDRTRSDYYRTPNIERLAETGMRFTQGYAPAPYCRPTRRSLLIGQTPARHVYQEDQENWPREYRKQLSLPLMLKAANPAYRTAHFGKWDMRSDLVTPEEMGYDASDGYTSNGTGGGKGSGGPAAKDDPKLIFGITDRASGFIEEQAKNGNPFFVQVSHYAVHLDIYYRAQTLEGMQPSDGARHTMPEFAAMTSDMDTGIGELIDKIESLGLQNNTYVFFLSDNGGRRSIPGQETPEVHRNHPLRNGKGTMYEGGIRVPFIVIGPDVEPGSVSRTAVTGLDIFPTIAKLAGYAEPLPSALDGGSMTDLLFNGGQGSVSRNHPFLLFHHALDRPAQTALIQGDYKLVKTWKDERLELFDLTKDIGEEEDLSDQMPEKTEELHGMMVDFLTEAKTATHSTRDEPDPEPTTHRISTQTDYDALKPLVFNGGDEILFERGANFEGALSLKRSDVRPESAITVADFGSAEAPRPIIRADADGMGTIDIRDSGGWIVENLELINQSAVRSERHGIFVTASDSGTHKNFVVRNCLIHDVTGIHDDFNNGGIVFRVVGTEVPTKFDGVLIENNEIRNISGVGIRTKSTWEADPDDPRGVANPIGRHAHLNVVVRGNRVSDVTRNAIIIGSADAPLAEYNVMGPNIATETTGNTIYNYATDSALIQYNEAFGNHGPASDKDRGGFDADYNRQQFCIRDHAQVWRWHLHSPQHQRQRSLRLLSLRLLRRSCDKRRGRQQQYVLFHQPGHDDVHELRAAS